MASTEGTPPRPPKGLDRLLKRLGECLADDTSRRQLRNALSRWFRRIVGVGTFGYALLLLLVMLSLRWIGEKNLTLAFLLYLPRNAFLIPSAFLLLPAMLWHRWSALALVLGSLAFLFWGLEYRAGFARTPAPSVPGNSLTVLTYNRGEHMNQSLQPFKNLTRPDLILLQEAGGRAAGYLQAEGYEEFPHALDSAEFTLLSRYPILGAEALFGTVPDAPPIAARFTIDFEGREVAVYSVHTISPRDVLKYYRRGAFLYGLIGVPGTPLAQKRRSNQEYWDQRIEEARSLRDRIEADPLPVILAGDFNAPAGGYIHGLFRSRFQDAHARAGRGFGNTFPGTTRNPLSLGGPWMRIDYLFCNEAWEPAWCITEADRPSQHRAVAANFELN
jgi:vancomycin resistance protein VanJ